MERAGGEYTLTLRRWDQKVVRQVRASLSAGSWSWSWEKDWVWGQGSVLATIGATEGMQQVVVDHQGSVGLLANRCGQRLAELATNPWGLDLFSTAQNSERHRYTGHLRDTNALDRAWDDFDYMHARYYFPYTARFLSVDPGRDYDLSRPQSFNLYTYVRNNPVNLTDPDGRSIVEAFKRLVTGALFKEWFKQQVDKQTTPKTTRSEREKQEELQVLQEAGLPTSTQGAILGTGGAKFGEGTREGTQEVGGAIVQEVGPAVVTFGMAKGLSTLSRAKNISGKDLVKELERAGATVRPGRGSHMVVELNGRTATLPIHGNRSLGKGLLSKILKDLSVK